MSIDTHSHVDILVCPPIQLLQLRLLTQFIRPHPPLQHIRILVYQPDRIQTSGETEVQVGADGRVIEVCEGTAIVEGPCVVREGVGVWVAKHHRVEVDRDV